MTRMSLYFRFCWSMLMFLSTQLIMPFRYHVTNVGVRAVTTTMDQGGCILLRHTLLYCRLVTIKPQAKKIVSGDRTLTHFCIFVVFLQCGNVANSKNDFCSLCMSVCASFGGCGLLRWVTVRTLVLSGLSLLTDDVVRYIPKNCPLMETLDVSGCVQLTDCR